MCWRRTKVYIHMFLYRRDHSVFALRASHCSVASVCITMNVTQLHTATTRQTEAHVAPTFRGPRCRNTALLPRQEAVRVYAHCGHSPRKCQQKPAWVLKRRPRSVPTHPVSAFAQLVDGVGCARKVSSSTTCVVCKHDWHHEHDDGTCGYQHVNKSRNTTPKRKGECRRTTVASCDANHQINVLRDVSYEKRRHAGAQCQRNANFERNDCVYRVCCIHEQPLLQLGHTNHRVTSRGSICFSTPDTEGMCPIKNGCCDARGWVPHDRVSLQDVGSADTTRTISNFGFHTN